ncbi:MAG: hypothetical protein JJU29_19710, partial [Verrucomicrobia bacterium]|nr:hypothetical protein [Verrucomicrobiota bacterium]
MKIRIAILLFLLLSALQGEEPPLSFLETYARGKRLAALDQLTPGTDAHFYYLALHHQLENDLQSAEKTLADWAAQAPNRTPPLLQRMRIRQALLGLQSQPDTAWPALAKALELPPLPTPPGERDPQPEVERFDPARLTVEAFMENARAEAPDDRRFAQSFTERGLEILARKDRLSPEARTVLLSRAKTPDLPQLLRWILEDLEDPEGKNFGDHAIHGLLTLDQLQELAEKRPTLINSPAFVAEILLRLDWEGEFGPDSWTYIENLPPLFDPLKKRMLQEMLREARDEGRADETLLKRYLDLGDVTTADSFLLRDPTSSRSRAGDPFAEFMGASPASTKDPFAEFMKPSYARSYFDETLVRELLHDLLRDADTPDDYAEYFEEDWLWTVFAESKIMHGTGDLASLSGKIPAESLRKIQDRRAITFPVPRLQPFAPGEDVNLVVDTVGVSELTLKIYEMRNFDLLRDYPVVNFETFTPLAGMIPTHERKIDAATPPGRRVRHELDFPEIHGRGVWVIHFFGGGLSTSIVLRIGRLETVTRSTRNGMEVKVFTEAGEHLPEARIWMNEREFVPDERGRILVPFSENPTRREAKIRHGEFSQPIIFQHVAKNVHFEAGAGIDPQTLTPFGQPLLILRPDLRVNGYPISPEHLKDVRVSMDFYRWKYPKVEKSTQHFEVAFTDEPWLSIPFDFVEEFHELAVTVTAGLHDSRDGEEIPLKNTAVFTPDDLRIRGEGLRRLNSLFQPSDEGWWLETFDLTGADWTELPTPLYVQHPGFNRSLQLRPLPKDAGRIHLGPLNGVSPRTRGGRGISRTLLPKRFDLLEGETLSLPHPYPQVPGLRSVTLLHTTPGRKNLKLFNDHVEISDGELRIQNLPPGHYTLRIWEHNDPLRIHIHAGHSVENIIFGEPKRVIHSPAALPSLAGVEAGPDGNILRIRHADSETRVAVRYHRYAGDDLALERFLSPPPSIVQYRFPDEERAYFNSGSPMLAESAYLANRDPRPAFAGSLLTRPSLQLNPWELREVEFPMPARKPFQRSFWGRTGVNLGTSETYEEFYESHFLYPPDDWSAARDPNTAESRALSAYEVQSTAMRGPSRDFGHAFYYGAVWEINLTPDEEGRIVLPDPGRPELTGMEIWILAPRGSSRYLETRPDHPMDPHPEVMTRGRIPDAPHLRDTAMEFIHEGESAHVSAVNARTLTTLTEAFNAFRRLNDSVGLSDFAFLTNWHQLDEETKHEKLAQYASHELHLFLHARDPDFFETSVRPVLENKFQKSFVDRWLLDELTDWDLQPDALHRRNTLELVLLARRGGNAEAIRRVLRERRENTRPAKEPAKNIPGILIGTEWEPVEMTPMQALVKELQSLPLAEIDGEVVIYMDRKGLGRMPEAAVARATQDPFAGDDFFQGPFGDPNRLFGRVEGSEPGTVREPPPAPAPPPVLYTARDTATLVKERGYYEYRPKTPQTPAPGDVDLAPLADQILSNIRIPELRFQQADFRDVITFLQQTLDRERPPVKARIRFESSLLLDSPNTIPKISLEVREVTLLDALQLVTEIAGVYYRMESTVHPPEPAEPPKPEIPLDHPDRIPVHDFWLDAAGGDLPSPHPLPAHDSLTEILVALAWSGLPFEAPVQEIAEGEIAEGVRVVNGPALILRDGPAPGPYNLGRVSIHRIPPRRLSHGLNLISISHVVTNLTQEPLDVDVVQRLPEGAMPQPPRQTFSEVFSLRLKAHESKTINQYFAYPGGDDLVLPPIDISADGKILARTEPWAFNRQTDLISPFPWFEEVRSLSGAPNEAILNQLKETDFPDPIGRAIRNRMHDPDFYHAAIAILKERLALHPRHLDFAIHHRDLDTTRALLAKRELPELVGPWLETAIFPDDWQLEFGSGHIDIGNLESPRAHPRAGTPEPLNPDLKREYHKVLDLIAHQSEPTPNHLLQLAVLLLTQERLAEARDILAQIDEDTPVARLQRDYLRAWLATREADAETALALAHPPHAKTPPPLREKLNPKPEILEAPPTHRG